jgi:TIR domain
MAHEVFISHSSLDKPVADAVCAALEKNAIRCWIAPRDVQPGRSFAGEITRAIQHSKVMVLIFSAHTNTSEQVLREVQLAANAHLHIVQFRIQNVLPNEDLEYYLSTPHWLDALTPPLESHLERLKTSVKALLDMARREPALPTQSTQTPPPPAPPISSTPAPHTKGWPSVGKWWIAAAAIALLVFSTVILPHITNRDGPRLETKKPSSVFRITRMKANRPFEHVNLTVRIDGAPQRYPAGYESIAYEPNMAGGDFYVSHAASHHTIDIEMTADGAADLKMRQPLVLSTASLPVRGSVTLRRVIAGSQSPEGPKVDLDYSLEQP